MRRPWLALAAFVLAVAAVSAKAQEPPADPDEATGLRVTKAGGDLALSWQAPVTTPDSYQVRRCLLTSLPVTYYGNCVAEGLALPSHREVAPAGNVFYLVSGTFGGVEGSLGRNFDGLLWRDRSAPACSNPSTPGPVSIDIVVDSPVDFCAMQVLLRYPTGVTYVDAGSGCADLTPFGFANDLGGDISVACTVLVFPTPATGPGIIAHLNFQRGDCPLLPGAFTLGSCVIVDGVGIEVPATCSVR